MRALACTTARGYATELAVAFAKGCERHGVACEVSGTMETGYDVVWLYGFDEGLLELAGRARCVVGDLGYWRERACELPMRLRPVRIAVDAQQPDAHLRSRPHPPDRFLALGLDIEPVRARGEHILLCGHSADQARRHGYRYGEWEANTVFRLRSTTRRPVVVRTKQNEAPLELGVPLSAEREASEAIRKAWAVVCLTGNIGADAILHGVPCFAEEGPGACYSREPLGAIDDAKPLAPELRRAALSDIAYWQWAPEEFASGELWEHLMREGIVA